MSITLCFIGDINLGRYEDNEVDSSFGDVLSLIDTDGYTDTSLKRIYKETLEVLKECDLVVGNLETGITASKKRAEKKGSRNFWFRMDPKYARVLKLNENMFLNIANNHIFDYRKKGMDDTKENLNDVGIRYSGAGNNIEDARGLVTFEISGISVGIFGCADHYDYWAAKRKRGGLELGSVGEKPPYGIYYVDFSSYQDILDYITEVKKEVDLLIMSIHWGYNFDEDVNPKYQKFAKKAFNAGVDIIYGHSSHHVKCVRWSEPKGKVLIYGIGDFINDYAIDHRYRSDLGMILKVTVEQKKVKMVSVIPTKISNRQVNLTDAGGQDHAWVRKNIADLCNLDPMDHSFLTKIK